ncbi:MAG TPA: hypothetical protein VKW04_01165, partial [Planctomycetota bacterium]|nr:hypothetical protein [Planctomycetota bacterium]
CAAALESVAGVASVGVGGSGTDYRLLVAVRDAATQRSVRELIGDAYGGVRIVWSIAERPTRAALAEPPGERFPPLVVAPAPAPPPAPDRQNPWNASALDCDIVRDYLHLKPVTHPAGNGKSWAPCQILKRTTLGPGGSTSFSYTAHRPDCPIRLGRVGEPAGSDQVLAWIFRQGITPPTGGAFTLPSSDWAWSLQAAADMASRMPLIREGASASGPVWIAGYGWLYPAGLDPLPWYPPCVDPYRSWWRPHHWIVLRSCHPWRCCR